MITKQQAIACHEFHYGTCTRRIGPRGGITEHSEIWRRNGQTKLWKTRPSEFRVPIKHGLYAYDYITHDQADQFHAADDCPLLTTDGEVGRC